MNFTDIEESRPDNPDEQLVFHYSRAERLKHAPKIVQDYYNGDLKYRGGLFRSLVGTKANRFMLFSLALCVIVLLLNHFLGPKPNEDMVAGVPVSLSAVSIEDTVYVRLSLGAPGRRARGGYDGGIPVAANIQAVDVDNQVISAGRILGKYEGEAAELRTRFTDFDIVSVTADVEIQGETRSVSSKIEKR